MSDVLMILGLLVVFAAAALIGAAIGGVLIGIGVGGLLVGGLLILLGLALSDGKGFTWRSRS